MVKTGVFLEIPAGLEGQVRSRSGLAYKNAVMVLNSPGTLDSDYRGEVGVILHNASATPFDIKIGDRIAQLAFVPIVQVTWVKTEQLGATARGAGGFGSTGVK
jgi:dUTP pyrophosphatase